MKKARLLNIAFTVGVLFSIGIFPFLMLFTDSFPGLGFEHLFAVMVSVFAIYIVARNKTIKRYFAESYEYLYIGMTLLSCVHISELFTEIIFRKQLGEYEEIVGLTLEHLFFYLGVLSIAYAFFRIEEPSIDSRILPQDEQF